jgi:hypothetical protein
MVFVFGLLVSGDAGTLGCVYELSVLAGEGVVKSLG